MPSAVPAQLPHHTAARYVTPLREGGSLPAVVEMEAGDLFVVTFRGAGQGAKVLVAELVVAELARAAGLPVPEVVLVDVDASFGRTERDPEIQDILKGSVGLNVGLRFLEAALPYDPVAAPEYASPELAAEIVWLDAFTFNLDRTPRNPNLLVAPADGSAEAQLWLIDHGAALYFHHNWAGVTPAERARHPFPMVKEHVLLPRAGSLAEASERMTDRLTESALEKALGLVPDDLLLDVPSGQDPAFETAEAFREAYLAVLAPRRADPAPFVKAAEAARQALSEDDGDALSYRR